MYLNFYDFQKEPFNITPDPEFLYLSPAHKEALAAIIYGVEQRKGFIAIVGEVGVGKTTILRSYLDLIDRSKVLPLYLFNANISFENLLKFIYREMGLGAPSEDLFDVVNVLHERIVEEYAQGRNIVLIIDEAQNMPIETLEGLRLLSNLETTKEKLIQIVFGAQPEFEQMLCRKELRQLKQRIAVRAALRPLSKAESLEYIRHRLVKAKGGERVFSNGAMNLIAERTNGIPRLINIFCDNSLITSFGYKQKTVDEKIAREILSDFAVTGKTPVRWRLALAALFILLSCTGLIYFYSSPGVPKNALNLQDTTNRTGNIPKAEIQIPPVVSAEGSGKTSTPGTAGLSKASGKKLYTMVPMTVKKGDTLAKLIVDTYGYVNHETLELVKRHNPLIKNENLIIEGEHILIPMEK
jgi:general secretion pathway protein A